MKIGREKIATLGTIARLIIICVVLIPLIFTGCCVDETSPKFDEDDFISDEECFGYCQSLGYTCGDVDYDTITMESVCLCCNNPFYSGECF